MPKASSTEICGLNVNASPHPPQTYPKILTKAATLTVKARGNDYAKITKPKRHDRWAGLYMGRILIWTDIDLAGRWLDLSKEDDLPDDVKRTINIPATAKPNYRTFDYVLDEQRHHIWFQIRNELHQRIGPTTALRIFSLLLTSESLGRGYPEVSVAIIPEEGAVDRILSLPRLNILTFRITKPNADASSPEALRRVLATLDEAHAQQLDLRLKRARGASQLTPTGNYEELARVAADTGFVKGEETGLNGTKNTLSTEELPKRIQIPDDNRQDFVSRVRAALRL